MPPTPLTVSELTWRLRDQLQRGFGAVWVQGEVSEIKEARSGHWYVTLKDEGAVLSGVMFRSQAGRMRWRPRVGDVVLVHGGLDIYPPSGRYNMVIQSMEQVGAGDLQARIEATKRKLAAEGLMDPARKRPLPKLPRAVGVATSATGAALQDILRVLEQRFAGITVYVSPCKVQGEGAPEEIVAAIERLVEHGRSDVLIVGRGGGSQEDLMAFNDEAVARAVAASPIPVVSAVGHEVDVSIADLVADVRAATPSHAAELVVPERQGLLDLLDELERRLAQAAQRQLQVRRQRLDRLVLRDPRRSLQDARLRCDALADRLQGAAQRDLQRRQRRVEAIEGRLQALSPVAVLSRGYAVVLHRGRAVVDAEDLKPGDRLELRLARGSARARVEGEEPKGPRQTSLFE